MRVAARDLSSHVILDGAYYSKAEKCSGLRTWLRMVKVPADLGRFGSFFLQFLGSRRVLKVGRSKLKLK